MSQVVNLYLSGLSLKVRSKSVAWEVSRPLLVCEPLELTPRTAQGYQRANLLSAEDVALIQRVTGQKAQSETILAAVSARSARHGRTGARLRADAGAAQEGEVYASLYIRLLNKLSRADTVQSLLSLISDMLQGADPALTLNDPRSSPSDR